MKDNQFPIILENGTEQICDFLFKYTDQNTNKNYIFFQIVISGIYDVVEYYEDDNKDLQLITVTDENTRNSLNIVLENYNNDGSELK